MTDITAYPATVTEGADYIPGVGMDVYDAETDTHLRIVATEGQIQTGRAPGAGNWQAVEVIVIPGPQTAVEWDEIVDCGVVVDWDSPIEREGS